MSSLAEAEAEAGVEDGAEDDSVAGIALCKFAHQNPFVDSLEYER